MHLPEKENRQFALSILQFLKPIPTSPALQKLKEIPYMPTLLEKEK
jgi:hypothetical protein